MIGLNKIGLNQVQLNRLRLNAPFPAYGKMAGGGGSGDGFPVLPGDVTRWHFGGLTNEMMAAMDDPRIEDADGKGRFLSFKNFAWGGMSGVGGYSDNFSSDSWKKPSDRSDITWTSSSFNITRVMNTGVQIYYFSTWEESESVIPEKRIIVKGLEDGQVLRYMNVGNRIIEISQDGIYTIPSFTFKGANSYHGYSLAKKQESCNVTVEQLPIYPGALVFDGVDDYGTCDNFPILNKEKGYTVVALRQWINNSTNGAYLVSNAINNGALGAFIFERDKDSITYSFGRATKISVNYNNPITYQISNSYNSVEITMGTLLKGNDTLLVGVNYKTDAYLYANVAIWELVFLDHDATEEELTKIKDYFVKTYPWLFPDQAWTVVGKTNEDEDRATIANITGNGNDLILSNFGFAEGSGYGLYAYNFNFFSLRDNVVKPTDVKKDSFRMIGTGNSNNVLILLNESDSADWKIRITGMKEGDRCLIGNTNKTGEYISVTKDGTYTFQKQYVATSTNGIWYNSSQEVDVLVEQIPEYEGYLVTDGADDKIDSSAFKMGEDFTVVGEWKLLPVSNYSYAGIIKTNNLYVYNNASIGISIYVCSSGVRNDMEGLKSLKAICSDGRVYGEDWTEYKLSIGRTKGAQSSLYLGYNGTAYTQMAFKNLGIYNNQILSKDDCIKAYNYLQTLKAK